jgi:hypothetical protein
MKVETNREYHSHAALSKSKLAQIGKTPAYFRWYMDNPQPPTSDLIIGQAFHKLLLEPETFNNEFAILPELNRRTKAGKEEYDCFLIEIAAQGKSAITLDDYNTICGMRDSIKANKYATALISNGTAEHSFYWTDELTKIECKCRPDYFRGINDRIYITDLKSCRSAAPDDIPREIVKYSYDLQSGMYTTGVSEVMQIPKENIDFIFIFVEKTAPYLINIVQADEFILQRGYEIFREYLGVYADCTTKGNWYGYNGFSGQPNMVSLPAYLLKDLQN